MDNSIEREKKDLAIKLKNFYVPYYVNFFVKLPIKNNSINNNLISFFIGILPFLGVLFLSKLVNSPLTDIDIVIFLNMSAIIIAAFALLGYAYKTTIDSLDETIKIIENKEQILNFNKHLNLMFKSKYQIFTCVLFTLILMMAFFSMDVSMEYPFKICLIIIAIFAFLSAGPGLWLAITSAYFISQLNKIGPLRLNTVYPSQTLGVKKLSKLLAIFSLSFSLETILFLFLFFFSPWNNLDMQKFITGIIVIPFILFMLFFFIYPQMGIKNIIVDYKEKNLQDIEDQIRFIYSKNILNVDDLDLITKYNDLYNKISGSSNHVIDLGVLIRFASSISFPLILIVKEDPNIIYSIFNIFKWVGYIGNVNSGVKFIQGDFRENWTIIQWYN